jgi:hypothetical protein
MLAEATSALSVLPGPGEAVHALMTGAYDLAHLLTALVGKVGPVATLRVATLSYNGRNLAEMAGWLDSGAVRSLALVCSCFFRDHNKDLWESTLREFRARGQRAAAARSHAKVVTLHTADGRKYALEGSANLRTNGNREQLTVVRDDALHDWHAAWIEDLVNRHEPEESPAPGR